MTDDDKDNERFIRDFDLSFLKAEDIVFEDGYERDEDLNEDAGITWNSKPYGKLPFSTW